MKKNNISIWKNIDFIVAGDESANISSRALGIAPLFKSIFKKTSGQITEYFEEGTIKEQVVPFKNKCVKVMSNKGARCIYHSLHDGGGQYIFLWEDGIAEIHVYNTYLKVRVMSHNEKLVQDIKKYFDLLWVPDEKLGQIYAIIRNGMNLSLSSIGDAGIPLIEDNYPVKVMTDYKFAINDLQTEDPSGRIVIMKGPAGTGKTHLIRAMLLEVPDAMFVLLSPDVIKNLAGPELLPLLMNYRGTNCGPIVLILEDADKCLVSRDAEAENMSSIQALLNLGDGILGSLLDLRIVATTNAEEFKMDPAILRPGRLSKMIDVSLLDDVDARKVFSRLLPETTKFPGKLSGINRLNPTQISLAEVYALARQHGWSPPVRQKKQEFFDDEMEANGGY